MMPTSSGRVLATLFLVTAGLGCGDGDGPDGGGAALSDEAVLDAALARERVLDFTGTEQWEQAFEVLLPLLQSEDPAVEDLVRAGQLLAEMVRLEESKTYFERAHDLTPDDPRVAWGFYSLAAMGSFFDEALVHIQRVLELVPDDYAGKLALANTYTALDRLDEARPHYQELVERGLKEGGSWYLSAIYRYHWNHIYSELDDEGGRWLDEFMRLKEVGIQVPTDKEQRRGNFGELEVPAPGEIAVSAATRLRYLGDGGAATIFTPDTPMKMSGLGGMFTLRLRDTPFGKDDLAGEYAIESEPLALVLYGPEGLRIGKRSSAGEWTLEEVMAGNIWAAAPMDLDALEEQEGTLRDDLMDLVVATDRGLEFLRQVRAPGGEITWEVWGGQELLKGFPVADITVVDFDHEGDMDLLVVGALGVRLLRNDGVPAEEGVFVDVTEEAGLPTTGAYFWCAAEDMDVDRDVDLLFGGKNGPFYAKSKRGGIFVDASATLPTGLEFKPTLADVNRDGRPDLILRSNDAVRVLANRFEDRWDELSNLDLGDGGAGSGPNPPGSGNIGVPVLSDFGDVDQVRLLLPGQGVLRFLDLRGGEAGEIIGTGGVLPKMLVMGDVSGDGVEDILVYDGSALTSLVAQSDDRMVSIELSGTKDNRRGVGAIAELRVGPLYRRLFWDGRPRSFSTGTADNFILRVNWPNGIVQTITDIPSGASYVIRQREGLIGSCPFLYSWNGETYVLVSDVLGITPLGLPIDAGKVVPPDHDEYVLVRGDQMVPKDGFFELQFTEELREVTYLDYIRLDVVDHPADVEILPNERFTFPPFPEAHTHTIQDALSALAAVDQEGRDWTTELSTADEELARTFEPLRGQFLGLADMHFLELTFDAEAVRSAEKLRLLMTGWLYWTDASVNMASAGHPEKAFVPPLLSIPDGNGGWTQVGPPLGFPAGKLKTMVVDVTPFINREDPRIRVSSTLALYWDAIRLATDADDADFVVHSIDPSSANLWERGFSEPLPQQGDAKLDWFLWDVLSDEPRWDQHPGLYTRLGETLPLLTAVDDRFIIMGSGDALLVKFPAEGLPEVPEGWTRDYLVYLDGWAKDRDPNTKEALYVEPLPFHAMSGYPYGDDESFPDTEEHRKWRREWNTRPSRQWIESLVPKRADR